MRLGSVRGEMYFLCMDVKREQAALSNLYFSLCAALKEGREERHRERERGRWLGVIELINLMAFVAHQTSQFSLCCLSSQPERSAYMMKSYELKNKKKKKKQDDKAVDGWTDIS